MEEKKSDLNDFVERVASSRIDVACLEYLAHFVTGEVSSKPDLPSQQRLGNFQDFLSALKEVQTEREARVEVDDLEIPEKFLDPITYNLMRDPLPCRARLWWTGAPSSGTCRRTRRTPSPGRSSPWRWWSQRRR